MLVSVNNNFIVFKTEKVAASTNVSKLIHFEYLKNGKIVIYPKKLINKMKMYFMT